MGYSRSCSEPPDIVHAREIGLRKPQEPPNGIPRVVVPRVLASDAVFLGRPLRPCVRHHFRSRLGLRQGSNHWVSRLGRSCYHVGRNCCRLGRSCCRLGRSCCHVGRSCCHVGRSCCHVGRSCYRLGRNCCRLGRHCYQVERSCCSVGRHCCLL